MHGNWRKPICFSFSLSLFFSLPVITVFQMGNNQFTSQQTPLRCLLDNWKLFDPLIIEKSLKILLCHFVAMVSSRGQETLAWGWKFKLQYHPTARIILQKTREMDRDPLFQIFFQLRDMKELWLKYGIVVRPKSEPTRQMVLGTGN